METSRATANSWQPPLTLNYDRGEAWRAARESYSVLAEIRYGRNHRRPTADPRRVSVGLRPLSSQDLAEVWRVPERVSCGWRDGIGFVEGRDLLFAHLLIEESGPSDLAGLTCEAYTRLIEVIRYRGFPYPLRVWNFLSAINGRSAGMERYQAFCAGRANAFRLAGIPPTAFPAATCVGSTAPGILIYLVAARRFGTPVENPRQVSAYRYPLRYGPMPPSFARALSYSWPGGGHVFLSGTASVVGHRTLHPGDCGSQLKETLTNLDTLLGGPIGEIRGGRVGRPAFLKVFLREPRNLALVEARIARWVPREARILYLQADICRAELEIEIEGLCCSGSVGADDSWDIDEVPA